MWLVGGAGVMLVYTAYRHKSPLGVISDVIGGQKPPVVNMSFTSVNAGPTLDAATTTSKAAGAVAFALAQIGRPYSHTPDGVTSFDCSLLVQKAYAAIGIAIPRTTYDQVNAGIGVSPNAMQPGDLIFYEGLDENGQWRSFGHVTMYIGGGKEVQAERTGTNVMVTDVRTDAIQAVRRFV